MTHEHSSMIHIILRGVRSKAQGFVRLDSQANALHITLCLQCVKPKSMQRILLLSAGEEGAALNLGSAEASPDGILQWTTTHAPVNLSLWDAVVLAEDWPIGRLTAAGWLNDPGSVWRLAEAASHFLAVPVK